MDADVKKLMVLIDLTTHTLPAQIFMFKTEIKTGYQYWIKYVDPYYPCNCDCHLPNSNMSHCYPCCGDHSFEGPATCVRKLDNHLLFIVKKNYYIIKDIDVIKPHLIEDEHCLGNIDVSDPSLTLHVEQSRE